MKAKDLRNSILQLAVQGKLVPQDPNDEPASVLLERVRAERAKLIKEKKIKAPKGGESVIYRASDGSHYEKRGKGEPVCIDDEIPFEIPESWAWVRLESVTTYIQRGKSPKYSPIKKYPVVAQKCNQWSGFSLELAKFIDPNSVSSYTEERILQDGDLLWNSTGLGTLGRMAIYDSSVNNYGWAVADSHVTVIRTLPDWLDHRYAFAYFAGPSVQSVIEGQASGSTKQKELAQDTVKSYPFPFPPRAEQDRIVDCLAMLMPRTDEYGALEGSRERLDAELPDKLRKSVLQLAVQGKLVPQVPGDEPASVLLERIRAERAKLIKEKKIKAPKGGESVIYRASDGGYYEKRGKSEPACIDDEIPFEIPESWEWVRLGSVLREIVVPQRDKPTSFDGDIAWCRIEDVEGRYLNRAQDGRYVSRETVSAMNLRICPPGTVFSACSGASIGRIAISTIECCTNQTFAGLVCSSGLFNEYLYVFLERIIPQLKQMGSGTTLAYISRAKYANLLLPLPPMDEQKRIVTSVEAMREQLS